ncbi:MAG: ATP-binding cassette domain-containing protein [Alphaproteobacteria bacterium]|nr:ATP-binding cassette domain-containing protein [Alphaproteobacteria bacterium]
MIGFRKRSELLASSSHSTPVSTMRSAWGLYSAFWRSGEKKKAYGMAAAVAAMTLADVYLGVQIATWWKDMYDAITAKDLMDIGKESAMLAGLFVGKAAIIRSRHKLGMGLHIMWRGWLTKQFTEAWMSNKAFFHLNNVPGTIDNPDARIAEDADRVCGHLIGLGMGGLGATTALISFTALMLSISGTMPVTIQDQIWNLPSVTFWFGFGAAAACAAAGTYLTHKIGSPLFKLNEEQQRREGNFRTTLMGMRTNAPEIASYEGQKVERFKLREAFHEIRLNWNRMRDVRANLMFFNMVYADSAHLLSVGIGGAAYAMSKTMTFGQVMMFADTFNQLRGSMSWFINVYPALFELTAMKNRLTSFAEKIEEAQDASAFYAKLGGTANINADRAPGNSIRIENLLLRRPTSTEPMLTVPELEIPMGSRVLITGESGSGKSTLLHAIRGLWKYGDGHITLPEGKKTMFAPQVPHVLEASTLRENICYDDMPDAFDDEAVYGAMVRAGIAELIPDIDRMDRNGTSWRNSLSVGQKQRLVFARILLHKPDIIFLDEATSALDGTLQDNVYRELIAALPHATIISVAHRRGVAAHHTRHLHIQDGKLIDIHEGPQAGNDNNPPPRRPQPPQPAP